MNRKLVFALVALSAIIPLVLFGCKGKAEKMPEEMRTEVTEPQAVTEATQPVEPAQTVATETIPPTASSQAIEKPVTAALAGLDRSKDIQRALKNAGFYSGTIDGKIGPRTKKAIEDFQSAKGLRADGKVGPKTWAELEKYLKQ